MQYLYHEEYGMILYPDNWFDVLRCALTWLLHPSFRRTWKYNSYWRKPQVMGCLERRLEKSKYPDLAGC